MILVGNIKTAEKLHQLILKRKTGSSKQLANVLQIDRTTLFIMMDELQELYQKISYSRKYETFYYENEMKQSLTFDKI